MSKRVLGLAVALGVSAAGIQAADEEGLAIVMQGNAAGATACIACHGIDGAGNADANFPLIGGMDAAYLARQLKDSRASKRNSPIMNPVAQALSDAEIAAVTAYYSKQRPTVATPTADADQLTLGKRIAEEGLWPKDVPACFSCHAPGAKGIGVFPSLAGQHAGYIAAQINEWKNGGRSNDAVGLMKAVSDRLTPEETQAVAAYLASLKP